MKLLKKSWFLFLLSLCLYFFILFHCLSDRYSSFFYSMTFTTEIEFGVLLCILVSCFLYVCYSFCRFIFSFISFWRKSSGSAPDENK